ncbi:MAG: thiamine phosphate synthase [Desulfobacterales bacterium]|uniref:Thiamine-phosphate synthase n=1 Tax=Candidatus Desulfatibia vada TaxID=2841696 RepID=A0A8J6TPZ6_9BACT|nr:thiamine phosphate synthase [Candidatus Desulfatibia vada]MBL6972435.1 thiamine phosphate synthase [Desulfobacterales bacterium]
MKLEARRNAFKQVDIYPVTCERLSNGRSNLEVLKAVIQGGARIIQLREKEYSGKKMYDLALKFREITTKAGVLLIINDHVDIAMAVEADGVHLGQDDFPLNAAKKIAPELLIGASTHSLKEAIQAQKEGADYINIGPIFPTGTKEGIERFLGPEAIAAISPAIDVPFTVMGGISESNIDQVLTSGARRVAMVTAITQAPDITAKVKALREKIQSYH